MMISRQYFETRKRFQTHDTSNCPIILRTLGGTPGRKILFNLGQTTIIHRTELFNHVRKQKLTNTTFHLWCLNRLMSRLSHFRGKVYIICHEPERDHCVIRIFPWLRLQHFTNIPHTHSCTASTMWWNFPRCVSSCRKKRSKQKLNAFQDHD